jgi:putative zinc finger/helix-turn-helix YgiT family protein
MIEERTRRTVAIRKESIEIIHQHWRCPETGELFTTDEQDERNQAQIDAKYRARLGIPSAREIAGIRAKYDVSAAKMSEILGLGANSYRNYEMGEIPSVANARLISLAADPSSFRTLVRDCPTLSPRKREQLMLAIHRFETMASGDSLQQGLGVYLFGDPHADEYTGVRRPDPRRFVEMVKFFAAQCTPFKTKLNKLLFYTDFMAYRDLGTSLSGMRYVALDHGPVPNRFQSVYEWMAEKAWVEIRPEVNGYSGERIALKHGQTVQLELFSPQEVALLHEIVARFGTMTAAELSSHSHLESAWTENIEGRRMISYEAAFDLMP